ncbi:hypothetical protein STCU_07169 [Strigomonas culicis]|nr:hypothetical protein STCU_08696 [Strigomonas culicis]EPY24460.1 hypothetical protein STCU_07169 [Strigomonas culicis]|eukprot:EPY21105.1 hypothetical protein STCU_08696 [Strigomonas culicis]
MRYQNEFRHAEEAMKKRKNAESAIYNQYDYDADQRFQLWRTERDEMRKRLHIHPIDEFMDRPMLAIVSLLRINTTIGMLYALGRTAYLYRTMDKMYAKLNGVSLGKIAFNELTTNVAKGGCISVVGAFGIVFGDAVGRCLTLFYTQQVSVPERTWWHVWCSGSFAGLCMGATLSAFEYKTLTRWGMVMLTGGISVPLSLASCYAGYCVYRPFVQNREHVLYDTYWRPWQQRRLNPGGPPTMRGRYM